MKRAMRSRQNLRWGALRTIFSFRTLEIIGIAAAIFAAIVGIIYLEDERQDRLLAREITAWSMLREASNSTGNLGQTRALELLRSQGANLQGVNLKGASLSFADLSDTYLGKANMEGALVEWSNFRGSFLVSANFKGSRLSTVIFADANLALADFSSANLFAAIVDNADFMWADFQGATIGFQSSKEADFSGANFSGTEFVRVFADSFTPKYRELTRGSGSVRLIGGSIDQDAIESPRCYAWAFRHRLPKELPTGYAIVLLDSTEDNRAACGDPKEVWP